MMRGHLCRLRSHPPEAAGEDPWLPNDARQTQRMITRTSKLLLVAGIALLYTLVVFNNLTDFDSNYQFVRHVLSMDSTFPGNHGRWRAIPWPWAHLAFYIGLIAWEIVTTLLLWWGVLRMFYVRRQ